MPAPTAAQRLLDAQVAWLLSRLSADALATDLPGLVDDLLGLAGEISVADAAPPDAVKEIVHLTLRRVPASAAASTVADVAATAAHEGPRAGSTPADVIDRDHLDALLGAALGRTDLVESVLDRVAESPLATTVASRFVARMVGDVLATNRAVAEKIPGVGGLVSLGSSVAGRVAGIADKQVEALLGDTAGKGATFAMRRLNKLLVETLKDPTTRAAVLEVYDLYADAPLGAIAGDRLGTAAELEELAGLVQDIVIRTAPSAPVLDLVDRLIDGFFGVYGDEPLSVLIEDLAIGREDIVAQAEAVVPGLVGRWAAGGELERILRARLAPFYSSDEVAGILAT